MGCQEDFTHYLPNFRVPCSYCLFVVPSKNYFHELNESPCITKHIFLWVFCRQLHSTPKKSYFSLVYQRYKAMTLLSSDNAWETWNSYRTKNSICLFLVNLAKKLHVPVIFRTFFQPIFPNAHMARDQYSVEKKNLHAKPQRCKSPKLEASYRRWLKICGKICQSCNKLNFFIKINTNKNSNHYSMIN